MSVIRKQPYIEQVIGSLSSEQLTTLKNAMNSSSPANVYKSLVNGDITEKEIVAVNLELALGNIKSGFLIYTNTYCVLVAYHQHQDIAIFKLDLSNKTYERVDEYCTIEELRRVCDEKAEAGGDAWVDTMKTKMVYNDETSEIEVGTHLYVDGKLEVGDTGGSAGDIVIGHELIIDDLQKIVDTNGDPFIPDPSGHLNECLVHYTSGYTWKKVTELSGIQVVDKATFEGSEFVKHTFTIYVVYDTDGSCYVKYFIN